MYNINYLFISILFISSCSNTNQNQRVICKEIILHFDNAKNDTSIINLKNTWVYDTTANSIEGLVLDDKNYKPIENAIVSLTLDRYIKRDTTDKSGQFEIWADLGDSTKNFSLQISHPIYKCLTVYEIIQSSGESIIFKLKRN
ncbi:MAG: hypothetical protein ABIO55_15080 [Ginsengibacter sp.]